AMQVSEAGGARWEEASGAKLKVQAAPAAGLRGRSGARVILGVRPEALRVANGAEPADCCFDTAVDVVEPLGNEILLNFRAGDVAMVARVAPGVRVKAHEPVRFALDPEQLYLFAGESEAAISPRPRGQPEFRRHGNSN